MGRTLWSIMIHSVSMQPSLVIYKDVLPGSQMDTKIGRFSHPLCKWLQICITHLHPTVYFKPHVPINVPISAASIMILMYGLRVTAR